jgi:nitrate/nitrite transporter NarK
MNDLILFARALWGGLTDRLSSEPVMVLAVVQAALGLAVSFGLGWTAEQVGTVLAFSAAILGLIARQKVTPAG